RVVLRVAWARLPVGAQDVIGAVAVGARDAGGADGLGAEVAPSCVGDVRFVSVAGAGAAGVRGVVDLAVGVVVKAVGTRRCDRSDRRRRSGVRGGGEVAGSVDRLHGEGIRGAVGQAGHRRARAGR